MDEPITSDDATTTSSQTLPASGSIAREPRAVWASAISMAEAGLLTDVSLVFDLAWIYIPILGTAFIPLIPTPFVILYLRRGARITLFAACVAGFLMTVLVGPHYGWRLTVEACIGLALGWAMQRRWPPLLTIALATLVNSTVVYVAAFAAIYALGLPLHDLYQELRNALVSVGWLLDTSATLLGLRHPWLSVRPFFATVGHLSLTYWLPALYVHTLAVALPTDMLYYSVASTTARALGHDVRPFPPMWVWRALRIVGVIISPFAWLIRALWRTLTAPLWGPVWFLRAWSARRRRKRLADELASTPDSAPVMTPVETPVETPGLASAPVAATRAPVQEGRDT